MVSNELKPYYWATLMIDCSDNVPDCIVRLKLQDEITVYLTSLSTFLFNKKDVSDTHLLAAAYLRSLC